MRTWRRRKEALGVLGEYAKRHKSVYIFVNNNTNFNLFKILSNNIIRDRLSPKTVSRYCPFNSTHKVRIWSFIALSECRKSSVFGTWKTGCLIVIIFNTEKSAEPLIKADLSVTFTMQFPCFINWKLYTVQYMWNLWICRTLSVNAHHKHSCNFQCKCLMDSTFCSKWVKWLGSQML